MMEFISLIWNMFIAALRTLRHPEDVREWRIAYIYVWVPLGRLVLGVIVMVSIFIVFDSPWDWMLGVLWSIYFFVAEPMMYYIYGDGGNAADRYIETGNFYYDETVGWRQ